MEKYYISIVSKIGEMTVVAGRSKVTEELFFEILDRDIKELVDTEDLFQTTKEEILNHLKTKPLIVKGHHFEIKTK